MSQSLKEIQGRLDVLLIKQANRTSEKPVDTGPSAIL